MLFNFLEDAQKTEQICSVGRKAKKYPKLYNSKAV
jgi:hypothetical protein